MTQQKLSSGIQQVPTFPEQCYYQVRAQEGTAVPAPNVCVRVCVCSEAGYLLSQSKALQKPSTGPMGCCKT